MGRRSNARRDLRRKSSIHRGSPFIHDISRTIASSRPRLLEDVSSSSPIPGSTWRGRGRPTCGLLTGGASQENRTGSFSHGDSNNGRCRRTSRDAALLDEGLRRAVAAPGHRGRNRRLRTAPEPSGLGSRPHRRSPDHPAAPRRRPPRGAPRRRVRRIAPWDPLETESAWPRAGQKASVLASTARGGLPPTPRRGRTGFAVADHNVLAAVGRPPRGPVGRLIRSIQAGRSTSAPDPRRGHRVRGVPLLAFCGPEPGRGRHLIHWLASGQSPERTRVRSPSKFSLSARSTRP